MMQSLVSLSGPLYNNRPNWTPNSYPVANEFVPMWVFLSSAVLLHSLLTSLERLANFWVTRDVKSPARCRDEAEFRHILNHARHGAAASSAEGGTTAAVGATMTTNPRAVRLLRQTFQMEGAPLLGGLFGFLEWWLLTAALISLFFCQVSSAGPASGICADAASILHQHSAPVFCTSILHPTTVWGPTGVQNANKVAVYKYIM